MWNVVSSVDRFSGTSGGAGAGLPMLLLAVALLSLSGCRQYHYVVRHDGVALFSDESRTEVIGRMPRYHHGALGLRRPGAGLVEVEYEGRQGIAEASGLRIFSYPYPRFSDSRVRDETIRRNIREVILEGSGWSDVVQAAVRADRILHGFTREQVELAWGLPRTMVPAEDGGMRWIYRFTRYRARDEVYLHPYQPARAGISYWSGSGWAFDFTFPAYSATLHRHYFPVNLEREVLFDRAGRVAGWEGHDR